MLVEAALGGESARWRGFLCGLPRCLLSGKSESPEEVGDALRRPLRACAAAAAAAQDGLSTVYDGLKPLSMHVRHLMKMQVAQYAAM